MANHLRSWIDLFRQLQSASIWWFVVWTISFLDCYMIVHFGTSFLSAMRTGSLLLKQLANFDSWFEAMRFGFWSVTVWLYLLPVVVVPLWRKALYAVSIHAGRWLFDNSSYPTEMNGWHHVGLVRKHAVVVNNPLLVAACDARIAEAHSRDHRLACVLGCLLFCFAAYVNDTSLTGPSLLSAAVEFLDELPRWQGFFLYLVCLPAWFFLWLIIVDHGEAFDGYIHLPDYADRVDGNRG